jgi:hypothetical protein
MLSPVSLEESTQLIDQPRGWLRVDTDVFDLHPGIQPFNVREGSQVASLPVAQSGRVR